MSNRGSFVNPPQLGVLRPRRSLSNSYLFPNKSVIPGIKRRKSNGNIHAEKELNQRNLEYIKKLEENKKLGEQILLHMKAYRKYYPEIALNNLEKIANYLKKNPKQGIQSRNLLVSILSKPRQNKLEEIKKAAIQQPVSLSQRLLLLNY